MLHRFAILTLFLWPVVTQAEPLSSCNRMFVAGQPPSLLNRQLANQTQALCYRAFAVLESGLTRGALWSAEHLSAGELAAARDTPRVNLFHPDPDLPVQSRAELGDYARSGYDRGHMAPSGDMPDAVAQQQSFSLANIVPQTPELNRGIWEHIESAVRSLARRQGELFVVTGPAFQGSTLRQIGSGVLVPTATWKAVYVPTTGDAGAYLCTNTARPACSTMSVAALAAQVGVDPFPSLSAEAKATLGRLPVPRRTRVPRS